MLESKQNGHSKTLRSMNHSSDVCCFKLTNFSEIKASLTKTGLDN